MTDRSPAIGDVFCRLSSRFAASKYSGEKGEKAISGWRLAQGEHRPQELDSTLSRSVGNWPRLLLYPHVSDTDIEVLPVQKHGDQ